MPKHRKTTPEEHEAWSKRDREFRELLERRRQEEERLRAERERRERERPS